MNIRTTFPDVVNQVIYNNQKWIIIPDTDSDSDDTEINVTIIQPDNYTITVKCNNKSFTESFTISSDSTYSITLTDNSTGLLSTDYYKLNCTSRGKFTRDVTIQFIDEN
jgi:hypothetical protein